MSLRQVKKSIFVTIGTIIFVFGLLFLLIPILPGILFAVLGLSIISTNSSRVRENKIIKKYLKYSHKYMNSTKHSISKKKKGIAVGVILFLFIASALIVVAPAQASYGIDSSYTQVKGPEDPTVYYLDHNLGKKKAYVSEESYLAYGNRWSDVKIINPESLRAWGDINLVKSPGRSEVFYIENGTKKWIQTEQEFIANGYNWNDIVAIAQVDLDNYVMIGENPYPKVSAEETEVNNVSDNSHLTINTVETSNSVVVEPVSASVDTTSQTISNNSVNSTGNISDNSDIEVGLHVSASNYSATQYIPMNTSNNLVAVFNLAATGETVDIRKLSLKVSGVFDRSILERVYIMVEGKTKKYEGNFMSDNMFSFNLNGSDSITCFSGRDKDVKVYVDFGANPTSNFGSFKISLNSKEDIQTESNIYGSFPLESSNYKLQYVEDVLPQVQIEELSLNKTPEVKIGSVDQEVAKFKITEISGLDNVKIKKLVFESVGNVTSEDINSITLENGSGKNIAQVKNLNSDQKVEFYLNNYTIKEGKSEIFSISLDIAGGENKVINFDLSETDIIDATHELGMKASFVNINETVKIVREKLGVISESLTISKNVFAEESGTLIGVYQIRNNDQKITLKNIQLTLTKSEFAPSLKETIYLANYDTGEVYSYANPSYGDYLGFDLANIDLTARKTINLALIADIPESSQQGDRYGTELNIIKYRTTENRSYLTDTVNVLGAVVTVSKANLFVYSNTDMDVTDYVKGEDDIKIASFYIEASYGDDVKINSITLNKGNTSGFVTYENGFSDLRVKIGSKQVGATISQPFSDTYSFGGFSYILKSGKRAEVSVYVDTESDLNVNNISLAISRVIAYSNNSGIQAVVQGTNSNSDTINFGQLALELQATAGGDINPGEADNRVGSFQIENSGDEKIKLGGITLLTTGNGFSTSLGYRYLEIREHSSSRRLGYMRYPVAGANRISFNSYVIEKNETLTFDIYVDADYVEDAEGFELRLAELTGYGYRSKVKADVSGAPTSAVVVENGTSPYNDSDNDDDSNSDDSSANTDVDIELAWPVLGAISATWHDPDYSYAYLGEHEGIDIVVDQGTEVKAAQDGVVYSVVDGGMEHASYIIIDHGNGFRTLYGHMLSMDVQVGDVVSQGDVIGLSGGTPGTYGAGPYTNGAHLHFEVHLNGIPVNPELYLD